MGISFLLYVALCACSILVHAVPISLFFPYGDNQDLILPKEDDVSSPEVQLQTGIAFYDNIYKSIFVNSNGHLSFETEVPSYQADLVLPLGIKLIAIFLADVDTREAGTVYYRETNDATVLDRARVDIVGHFAGYETFQPTNVFVVTWDNVGRYDRQSDKVNTFQVVIASDGQYSFAIFNYLDNGVQWIVSEGKNAPVLPDVPAQAGFDSGEGRRHLKLPSSGTDLSYLLATDSNVNVPGVWMFRIGNTLGENIKSADLNVEGDGIIFEIEQDDQTCLTGQRSCHQGAQCVDFNPGFCCECVVPLYGNGRQCLEPKIPQRVNGKISGVLNNITLSGLEQHSYIVTADGRAYTAISRVPADLGKAMLTLSSIGGVIGWLFAVPASPNAINGYSVTGGEFNRTARIRFQTGEEVIIRQTFFGHDALNNMRLETNVQGSLPRIPFDAKITVDDYKEEYRRVAPGTIQSTSTHLYRVDDIAFRYTWDQTIVYKECEFDPNRYAKATRLSVARNFVVFDDQQHIIRYALTNKIGQFTVTDPCKDANQNCDSNADCVSSGNSYSCECRPGFDGSGQTCNDIDECSIINICSEHARCYNVPGSFQCQCIPGYRGDGRQCTKDILLCGEVFCDKNAHCVFNNDLGVPMCECKSGFMGNGIECSVIEFGCNEVNNCDANAECIFDHAERKYICECKEGFSGDGVTCTDTGETEISCRNCDRNAECEYDVDRLIFRCECREGFTGDGVTCSQLGDRCGVCDQNARCIFEQTTQAYACQCNPGYRGDGRRCDIHDCRLHQDCDVNADCVPDRATNSYQCRCNAGFGGDGRQCVPDGCNVNNECDVNAECIADPRDTTLYMCRCMAGYQGDGKVCFQRIVPCNEVNNCDPNAECIHDPEAESYRCRCRPGYEGDGVRCRELTRDCSNTPQLCSRDASCILNVDVYICVCNRGFRGDGRTCAAVGDDGNYLIFIQGSSILRIPSQESPEDRGERLMHLPGETPIGLEYDCSDKQIYWTDVSGGTINRANRDGSEVSVLINGLSSPEGIAVDWIAKNIYWTDSGLDVIQVSRLNGSFQKTLFDSGLVNPRAIVLDPGKGTMYWSDWNRDAPKIEKANMDGTERSVFVETELGLPNGLTFDHQTQHVCWGDAGVQMIECMRIDGVGRRTIYGLAPYPFSLALLGDTIFWTDWEMNSLPSISRNGGQVNEARTIPYGGNGRLYGITTVRECPRITNACAASNGGCRFLCLPTPVGGRTCACPDDVDPETCRDISYLRKK